MPRRIPALLSLLLAAGWLLALFGRLLTPGQVLANRDIPQFHLPLRTAFRHLAEGGLPVVEETETDPQARRQMKRSRIVNGIGRIGYYRGGKSALWQDEDMAGDFTKRALKFIDRSKDKPFGRCRTQNTSPQISFEARVAEIHSEARR